MVKGEPWLDVPDIWKGEKQYLNWLRGQIRRIWSRHPIKIAYCKQRETLGRVHAVGNGLIEPDQYTRAKKFRCCEMCEQWFPVSGLEVDHIHGGKGFDNYEEFLEWQHMILFVTFEDIRELCKECHGKVTLSQKLGCSLEDIPYHQERIAFTKMKAGEQNKLLESLELSTGSNPAARLQIFMEHLGDKYDKT